VFVTDNEQLGLSAACCCVCWQVIQRGAWSEWSRGSFVSTNTTTESTSHCTDSRRATACF